MKFSIKIFLALSIFLWLCTLVGYQSFYNENVEKENLGYRIFSEISPFWKYPPKENAKVVTIPIVIKNETTKNIVPRGKIFLSEISGHPLKNIGYKNGKLTDAISFSGNTIPTKSESTILAEWKGFGDEYVNEEGDVTHTFTSPAEFYGYTSKKSFAFWEKLKPTLYKHPFKIQVVLEKSSPNAKKITQSEFEWSVILTFIGQKTTINTGLFVTGGMVFIFLLLLWEFRTPKYYKK